LFSIFLLISVFIWFLNALSKNYTTQIAYPLRYEKLPEGSVFVGKPPDQLDLRINAHGYALLRYKIFGNPSPIRFDVSGFALNRPEGDSSQSFLVTRFLRDQVARQLPAELQVLEIKPDTLYFMFARSVKRKVKVVPDFIFQVDNQFTVKDGIGLEPDSVEVTGPDLVLDTLRQVFTVRTELGELTRSFSDKVRLQPLPDLEYDQSRVLCHIELERFTEVQLTLPVTVVNLPDSMALQTFPSRIRFTCNVGLSKYERVSNNQIRAVVDYEEIREDSRVIDVHIQNLPVFLLSYEYYPKSVEYLKSRR